MMLSIKYARAVECDTCMSRAGHGELEAQFSHTEWSAPARYRTIEHYYSRLLDSKAERRGRVQT
jgi:hypothetical protein